MAKNVKFNRLKNKAFATGSSKDADTIYFTTDTHQIILGGQIYGNDGYWTYENGNIYANNHKISTTTSADATATGMSFDQSIFSHNGAGYNALYIQNNVTESEWVGYSAGINLESKRTFAHDDVTYNIGAGIDLGCSSVTSGGVISGVSSYIDFKLGHAEFSDELSDYVSVMKLGHHYYQGVEDYTMNLGGSNGFDITTQRDDDSNSWATLSAGYSATRIVMGEINGTSNINYYVGNGGGGYYAFGVHKFNSDIIITPQSGSDKTGKVQAPGGFFQTSDIRKKNVLGELDLNKAYDLIDKCQTIIYTLKDNPGREQIGLIAQEVQQFFPEIVSEDSEGMLSLDYAKLTVVILRVLKDLIQRVSKLESK